MCHPLLTSTAVALALVACAKATTPTPAPSAAGDVAAEEADAVEASEAPGAPRDGAPSAAPPPLFDHMVGHYATLTTARDALIHGDLDRSRAQLAELAGHPIHEGLSEAEEAMGIAMQQAAAKGATGKNAITVARSVAETAGWCGRCHTQSAVDLKLDAPSPPEGEDVLTHMAVHHWVTDRLWEGLTAPSDAAWTTGATRLYEDMAVGEHEVDHGAERDAPVSAMAAYVHHAGMDAVEAEGLDARVDVFAGYVATCHDCHAETKNRPAEE